MCDVGFWCGDEDSQLCHDEGFMVLFLFGFSDGGLSLGTLRLI